MKKFSRLPLIDPRSTPRMNSISKGMGVLVIGIGCLTLIGWAFDIAELKSVVPGLATMKSMTAVSFILAGTSLVLQAGERAQYAVRICAFIIAFIGSLTLGEDIFNVDFGVDHLLFRDNAMGVLFPGRMAPATAVSFLLVGLALFFGDTPQRIRFKDSMVIAVLAISMLALIGYLYGVSSLYQIGAYSSMALHTALCFVILATGILLARPKPSLMQTILADTAGGYVLRRFLPLAFGLPILLGWIWLLGQRVGFYDTAFGFAIMVISLITTLTIFTWVNARQLTATDLERKQMEERFSKAFHSTPTALVIASLSDSQFEYVNDSLLQLLECQRDEVIGRSPTDLNLFSDTDQLANVRETLMRTKKVRNMETGIRLSNGKIKDVIFSADIMEFDQQTYSLTTMVDITERKRVERQLHQSEEKFSKAFMSSPAALMITRLADGMYLDLNEAYTRIVGYDRAELLGHLTTEFNIYINPNQRRDIVNQLTSQGRLYEYEASIQNKLGELRTVMASLELIEFNGETCILSTLVDITGHKQAEAEILKLNAELEEKVNQRTAQLAAANEQLRQLAIIDELTGLYNRRGFLLLAEEQLLLAKRTQRNLVVFYADLDNLKQINDQYGHTAGDEAITIAADALVKTFRVSDIKARLGGDEFIVVAIEAEGYDSPALLTRLEEKLAEKNQSMSVGAVSFDVQTEISIEDLIAKADLAMYEAKMKKRHRYKR